MKYKRLIHLVLLGIVLALLSLLCIKGNEYTSTNAYCNSCHVHDHAHHSWQKSVHHSQKEPIKCVDCHLPPKGQGYYKEKLRLGLRDIYAFYFKDSSDYNWKKKSQSEYAIHHTFETSCIQCHPKLFPVELSENGELAHWYYQQNKNEVHCIDCHTNIGHGPYNKVTPNYDFGDFQIKLDTIYQDSAVISDFVDFTETIPGSDIAFQMVAVKGDKTLGGVVDETMNTYHDSFFIGKTEVSWDEYTLFLRETESEGRSENNVDGISGATPPWGNPDQGWGMGRRPAITMTHQAARVYCQWLSTRTGKLYRLPTEAEWQYAAEIAYKGIDDLQGYVSGNMESTVPPGEVDEDKLGLKHMFGNVKEFCSDTYNEEDEYVLKGGSFKSSPDHFRPDFREATNHNKWLKTDPQIPKSIWWYSDCNDVGFRVVLTYKSKE